MTDKLVKELLTLKFKDIDTSTLLEVVNATPNAEIAMELLCGIWEEPSIYKGSKISNSKNTIYKYVSYDKWKDQVIYSYLEDGTKGGYFPKGTKNEDVTIETFNDLKCNGNDKDVVYLYIPTGELIKGISSLYLSSWNELKNAEEEEVQDPFR